MFKQTILPSTERDPVSYCVKAGVRKAEESAKWNGGGGIKEDVSVSRRVFHKVTASVRMGYSNGIHWACIVSVRIVTRVDKGDIAGKREKR